MITRITVRSFKSIEEAEIELGNLNVFVGANGSGKAISWRQLEYSPPQPTEK